MSVQYAVLFHVSANSLPTVLEALKGSATLVSVTPTEEEKQKKQATRTFVGGKRNKGIDGQEFAKQIINREERIYNLKEIEEEFVAKGFARTSAYSCLGKLVRKGEAVRAGQYKFARPGVKVTL